VPGLIVAVALSVYMLIYANVKMIPVTDPVRWSNIWTTAKDAVWALMAPVVILGGIYGGAFTPTEAAGIACIYAIGISIYVYKELTWSDLWGITLECAVLVAQIMVIVAAAGAYSWLITTSGFPTKLVGFVDSLALETWLLLLVINLMLLCVGSVLEPPAAILVLAPLLMPLVAKAGIDPIHFGLVVTVNLAIGMFMPPFGLNLFASQALFGTPLPQLYRGVIPFLLIYLAILALLTYVPAITLVPLSWFG
jgi:C4-dicarboxylate transporter DctM subunit